MSNYGDTLKTLRKNQNMTQEHLASLMGISQDRVSRLENGSDNMTVEELTTACEIFGVPTSTFIKQNSMNIKPLNVKDVYGNINFKKDMLNKYILANKHILNNSKKYNDESENFIKMLKKYIDQYGCKPVVTFVGPSDAGKSKMINCITGLNNLVAKWTPMTSATVYVKHIEDRPEWMGNDTVRVFKAESAAIGWNPKNFNDREYCEELTIAGGSYSVLEDYCNRKNGKINHNIDAAIVYMDAPVLKACDIIDSPGFGTEQEFDSNQAKKGLETADIIIFLSQSNSFLNGSSILFLKEVLKQVAVSSIMKNGKKTFSNFMIIGSQAHIIDDQGELNEIFDIGLNRLITQLNEDIIEQDFNLTIDEFSKLIRKRFFSYSANHDKEYFRKDFNEEFKNMLEEIFPELRNKAIDSSVQGFKLMAQGKFVNEINTYEGLINERSTLENQYKKAFENKPHLFENMELQKKILISHIKTSKKQDIDKFREWENKNINIDTIKNLLVRKNYNKKEAKEYLLSNVIDLYQAEFQKILTVSVTDFNKKIEESFKEIEIEIDDFKFGIGGANIPFDFKGTLAGILSGIATLGALSLWAASFGNLAGYILIAKGVSVLSALGISVGGTAAAASFVAAIGGPITIGIGLALLVGSIFMGVFGDGWKSGISKQAYKILTKENVLSEYENKINKTWDDTEIAINTLITKFKEEYEKHLNEFKNKLYPQSEEDMKKAIEEGNLCLNFFMNIPW